MKRGQIWVETVIYTLIGLAVIGIVLGIAKPKIDEKKDQLAVEQAIEALNKIDKKILEVQTIPGNRRIISLKVGKGQLIVDPKKDELLWKIPVSYEYSESGLNVSINGLTLTTYRDGSAWRVEIRANYSSDILAEGSKNFERTFNAAPTEYRIYVENKGKQTRGVKTQIDIGGT